MEFEDIVDKVTYDKMRPPKPEGLRPFLLSYAKAISLFNFLGKATTVRFHVTVMSLDTIDEGSMVWH